MFIIEIEILQQEHNYFLCCRAFIVFLTSNMRVDLYHIPVGPSVPKAAAADDDAEEDESEENGGDTAVDEVEGKVEGDESAATETNAAPEGSAGGNEVPETSSTPSDPTVTPLTLTLKQRLSLRSRHTTSDILSNGPTTPVVSFMALKKLLSKQSQPSGTEC